MKYRLNGKINLILIIFVLMLISGILLFLKSIQPEMLFKQVSNLIIISVFWVILLVIAIVLLRRMIVHPLKKVSEVSKLASAGDLSKKINYDSDDEIGEIASSIDLIIENQINLAEFSNKIGDGDFNYEYEILSEQDQLGHSITNMRDKLKKLAVDDQTRNWSSEGLTQFSEIIRKLDNDLKVLCDTVLSELVKYLKGNQGMIFLLKEEDNTQYLELTSTYAWNKKKFIEKRIELGEGLIGQTAIEKETTYMTDVPESFIRITSGLGDENPTCIIIIPFLFDDELFGLAELAFFRELQAYEKDFLEKIAEIMASTFSRVRNNEQTKNLLKDSQKLTEELKAREEEMRQNLEEMNATQEEMQQREVERIGIFSAINNTLGTIEFDMQGKITEANEQILTMLDYDFEEVMGKSDRMLADQANEPIEEYNEFWEKLQKGHSQKGDYKRLAKSGREVWINASYTPVMDKEGNPYKVIMLATNITEKKKTELETQRQSEELKSQGEKLKAYTAELEDIKHNLSEKLNEASQGLKKKIQDIETEKAKNVAVLEGCVDGLISFNQDGIIEYFNKAAEEIWGIQRESVLGKPIKEIFPIKIDKNEKTLTAFFEHDGTSKEIGVRTEVSWVTENGNEFDLLATLTRAKVDSGTTFTIFAQKISIDLF